MSAAAKAAVALGCASETPAHYRIIRRLNEIGFFHAGGILIGAHAFLAMGNMLLSTYRADDVRACWSELPERGPGWRQRAKAAIAPLRERMPELALVDEMASMVAPPRAPAKKAGARGSPR